MLIVRLIWYLHIFKLSWRSAIDRYQTGVSEIFKVDIKYYPQLEKHA
jgi:hypothetical protein